MLKTRQHKAFSMVEILIALVLLAIGLLGLAGMTQIVMRGNTNANHLGNATDVCQLRIEELKDVSFDTLGVESDPTSDDGLDFGADNGQIVQETGLNAQGMTHCQYFDQESEVTGSACDGVTTSGCTTSEVLSS
ncbi:MAG: prepilin-type N-terminal cleavage/methylation domain-containing protein, partial [Deltaproteobacteria bacterium]|nr:prepilin-type N-terminal cleavage/methylation domain-containing protein [Deltaproteobacteria bacterium]